MRGEWIEMGYDVGVKPELQSLSPCGESGLKSRALVDGIRRSQSLPMRGEWIEISQPLVDGGRRRSLPMRGEWIEMITRFGGLGNSRVSPHAGRVD